MNILTREENLSFNSYLGDLNTPFYTFCRLMQQLPAEITNIGTLTKEQAQMAAAVGFYADVMRQTILGGLMEISQLIRESDSGGVERVQNLGRLILLLRDEEQFLQEASSDYWDAAMEPCRQGP